jgi:hypothetical protein
LAGGLALAIAVADRIGLFKHPDNGNQMKPPSVFSWLQISFLVATIGVVGSLYFS